MSVKQSIYIDAPVEKVFDFCADPRRSWATGPDQMVEKGELIDVKRTKEGVGTYYSWTWKFLGLRFEGFDVYTEFVPNERITDRSSFGPAGTWTFSVEPEGSGTRLTMWRQPGAWALRPVDLLLDRFRASISRQALGKVKAELEKPISTAVAPAASGHGGVQ